MKVAIIGCGAIGGYVGAKLALAGERVTFIARGANLEAVQGRGVRLILADGTEQVASNVMAARGCVAEGAQELVILAVKAHQREAVAHDVPHLCGPEAVVVTMQNGIPYWYFHHHGGEWAGGVVRSVDPSGIIARLIPPETVVGCVVYPATELIAPGVVKHIEGDRFPVGELDGTSSERVRRVSQCFARAGGGDDDRGADHRAQTRHRISRQPGEAYCRRRKSRQAQDFDAAGYRGRAPAGARSPRRVGRGAGPSHRHAHTAHRRGVWSYSPARPHDSAQPTGSVANGTPGPPKGRRRANRVS